RPRRLRRPHRLPRPARRLRLLPPLASRPSSFCLCRTCVNRSRVNPHPSWADVVKKLSMTGKTCRPPGRNRQGVHHPGRRRALKIKQLSIGTRLAWLTVMDNALMLGLQTQRVMQRRMDVAANNLANVSTTGFKADGLLLEEADRTTAHAEEDPRDIRFVRDVGIVHYMEQGPIAMTGNPLDVALEGDGFFMVEGPN